jgi:hypothetical protein
MVTSSGRSTGSTSKELIPVLQEMREAVPRVGQDNSRLQRRSLLDVESINTSPQTFHRHGLGWSFVKSSTHQKLLCLRFKIIFSVKTALPFACNAPFIQGPARLKIKDPEISPTNRWLLERVGKLAAFVSAPCLGLVCFLRPNIIRSTTSSILCSAIL